MRELNTGIAGSSPTRPMYVYPYFCISYRVNRHLAMGRSLIQGVLPKCSRDEIQWKHLHLCEIWGFHGSEDSSRGFLGYEAFQCCGSIPTFRRTL